MLPVQPPVLRTFLDQARVQLEHMRKRRRKRCALPERPDDSRKQLPARIEDDINMNDADLAMKERTISDLTSIMRDASDGDAMADDPLAGVSSVPAAAPFFLAGVHRRSEVATRNKNRR